MSRDLTPKQKLFIKYYKANGHNATKAALKAGYSKKGVRVTASKLLSNTNIKTKLQKYSEKINSKLEITAVDVLNELAKIGMSNMKDVASWGPDGVDIKSSDDLSDDETAAISEVSDVLTEFSRTVKIKRRGKVAALKILKKHFDNIEDSKPSKGKQTLADIMDELDEE